MYWNTNWEILICLFQLFQLIVQYLEWLITTQDIVRMLILLLLLLGIMPRLLFHHCLLNPHSWHVFLRPHGILKRLKCASWLRELVEIMLSFTLYPNTGFNWFLKPQKSSLDWWCCLLIGRCCWIRSTTLSCLLILGLKRCMLYCLLVCGGPTWEFPVSKFVSPVRFFNVLKIAHKHPQNCWNRCPLLREGLDLGRWILSLGCHLVQMVAMPFSPVLIIWQSTLFWLHVL